MWHDNKRDIKYSYLLTGDEEMDRGALKRIVNADLEPINVTASGGRGVSPSFI
jgi:hypothetical protein